MTFRGTVSLGALALSLLSAGPIQAQNLREVSGTVTDQHHEPLKGAVVQVENQNTESVVTYVTGPDGHYQFKRLDPDTDYKIWSEYRGKSSKKHFLSKFNSKAVIAEDLTVDFP